jgi:hypothetical protein
LQIRSGFWSPDSGEQIINAWTFVKNKESICLIAAEGIISSEFAMFYQKNIKNAKFEDNSVK